MAATNAGKHATEISLRVVILGLTLSVIMGAANVYVGLKAGMTVSASIPAAVTAMLLFRVLFRDRSVLEANQVQTAASAGESLAAGIIFTMPALVLVGYWESFDFWTVTLVAFTGGLLGILFMIPMRRVFVTDNPELPYPEGVACAAVLQTGAEDDEGEGASDAHPLLVGAATGALFKLLVSFVGLFRGVLETAFSVGRIVYVGADISPMLVAVGAIVRLNVALLVALGGSIGWLVIIPALSGGQHEEPLEAAWTLWSTRVRYVGVGAMVVGGAHSIFKVRHGLVAAIHQITGRADDGADGKTDLPSRVIVPLIVLSVALAGWLYFGFTGSVGITLVALASAVLMSFFFTAVASYIVGLVGNSNSPVSGMTITAVLFTGLSLSLFGYAGMDGIVATLGVAAVVCCVACTAGDVCNDLKTGHLVGATPWRQQVMQILGVFVASFVMAPVLGLLHSTAEGGIGGRELPAPQAGLFASLTKALSGSGSLPMNMVALGVGIGVFVILVDTVLEKRQSTFRAHLMPIAVGIYLPFGLAPPILLGGVLAWFFDKTAENRETAQHRTTLLSSGVIAGESLMGIALAGLAAFGWSKMSLELPEVVTLAATIFGVATFLWLFRREARSA